MRDVHHGSAAAQSGRQDSEGFASPLQVIPQACPGVSQGVPGCARVSRVSGSVPRCPGVYPGVPESSKGCQTLLGCPAVCQAVQESLQTEEAPEARNGARETASEVVVACSTVLFLGGHKHKATTQTHQGNEPQPLEANSTLSP